MLNTQYSLQFFFSVSGSFGVCCCVREKVFQVEADAPLEIFKYYENDTWVGYLEFEEGGAQKNVLYKSQIINDWTRTNIKEVRQTVDIKTVFFKRNQGIEIFTNCKSYDHRGRGFGTRREIKIVIVMNDLYHLRLL